MRTERITVSLPADLVAEARNAVRRGTASSVSAYIVEAVVARQERERSLATLADLYGGPPPPEQLAQARRILATAV
jgi:antitoxin ParD1/3/4